MYFTKTARQIHELAIFSANRPPLKSGFVQEIDDNFLIGPFWAEWPDPPFVKTDHNMGPKILMLAIFSLYQTAFDLNFV